MKMISIGAMKKVLLSLLVMATAATSGYAALFNAAVGDRDWFNAANYDPIGVPTATDSVEILNPHGAAAVRIDAPGAIANAVGMGKWSHPGRLVVGASGTLATTAHILMGNEGLTSSVTNHGQISVGSVLYSRGVDNTFVNHGTLIAGGMVLGETASAASTFSNTGDVTVNGWLHLSVDSPTPVVFNLNGGTLQADHLQMNATGSARLNLHGGTMTLGSVALDGGGAYTIDISGGGELTVHGDQTGGLNYMISEGFITASGGGAPMAVFDGATTTLKATFASPIPRVDGADTAWVYGGEAAGTLVGTLGMEYPGAGETYSYSFDPTLAGNANASFTMSGTHLLTAASLNAGAYPISIIGTDTEGGAFTNQAIVITVTDEVDRIEIQAGRFVSPRTGREFAPKGFNYIKLRDQEAGQIAHSTFDPAFYVPEEVESMFADLETNGFNTVRVFLDPVSPLPAVSLFASSSATGLSPVYMNNLYDFLRRAGNHGIYVIVGFSMWGPSVTYLQVGSSSPMVTGPNTIYFRDGAAETRAALLAEVCSAIQAHDPKLLPVVLAYEPQNELCYFVDHEPLSLTEGLFTYQGQIYDLSSDAQVRNLLDDVSVNWCNTSVQAVQAIDPHALVSIDVFTYHAVGRTGPDGPFNETGDTRIPARPLALAGSDISYLDIHLYEENMADDLESIEFEDTLAACTNTGKPLLMGEFGNHSAATAAAAASILEQHVANAKGVGFTGFLLWTYDLPGSWWNTKDDHGEILQALAQAALTHYPPSQFEAASIQADGTDLQLRWNTTAGENYQLLHSASLTDPAWSGIGGPVAGTGAAISNSVPATVGQGFYKVRKNN